MLIEEITELKEWSKYDPSAVKDVKYGEDEFSWDETTRSFTNKRTNAVVDAKRGGILFKRLIDDTKNKVAIVKGQTIGQKIGKGLGMTGVGQRFRKGQKGGILQKTLGFGGEVIGRGLDNISNAVAGGIKDFKKGRQDAIDKNKRDAEAPENNLDAFDFQQQIRLGQGDKDPREFTRDPQPTQLTKDRKYKNPNFNKTVGVDAVKLDWPSLRDGKTKTVQPLKPAEVIAPGNYMLGVPTFQFTPTDPKDQNKNNPEDDYENLKAKVQKGEITSDDANTIIKIANDGRMHLNKAYRIWQQEKIQPQIDKLRNQKAPIRSKVA